MKKEEVLQRYFGHGGFRKGQAEVIDSILGGRDILAVMPTGAGKSMCYQIPALILDGVTIVVSPLISLMKDQVEALRQSGVSAAYINSTLSPMQTDEVFYNASMGVYKLIYVAPERLSTEGFMRLAATQDIPLVAVDEAHCVSHWGQDFRPSYLRIAEFVSALGSRPVVAAFTATATDIVKSDIERLLCLNSPYTITTGFDRANLYFEVRKPDNKDAELLDIIRKSSGGSTIVYCSTRKNVESVCGMLRLNGCNAAMYHAGLADNIRREAQEDFLFDRVNVMVATNAFGMGIDKSDVSLVVHYNMPKDLESYYQEAGRAGRDGSPARCILLYAKRDKALAEYLIDHSRDNNEEMTESELEQARARDKERLKQMTFYSTTTKCLRHFILRYFGESSPERCGNCSSCNAALEAVDITVDAQKILSCVYRLKQRGRAVGKNMLSLILSGSGSEKIRQNGFDALSTYGIMKGTSLARIVEMIDYLEREGYLSVQGDMPVLTLTDSADEFIRQRRTLIAMLAKEAPRYVKEEALPENPELFSALKELRKRIATTLSVPAFVVFSDATLRDMSAKMPVSPEEFRQVSGVGTMKAERYGKQFMEIIRQFKK